MGPIIRDRSQLTSTTDGGLFKKAIFPIQNGCQGGGGGGGGGKNGPK